MLETQLQEILTTLNLLTKALQHEDNAQDDPTPPLATLTTKQIRALRSIPIHCEAILQADHANKSGRAQ